MAAKADPLLSVRVPKDLIDKLDTLAKKEQRQRSWVVRTLLERALKARVLR